MSIKNPDTGAVSKVHSAIVASGSQYFLNIFKKKEVDLSFREGIYDECKASGLDVPRPVKTAQNPQGLCSDEIINLILKYIYHNQNFNEIKTSLTEWNIN